MLLHEGGAPYDGTQNDRYTIPVDRGQKLIRLPPGLFLNDWIHVLEDSEIAFILMIACLHALFGEKPVFAAGEIRLLQFGVGRETYQAHHMLSRFNLIDVEKDPKRDLFGSKVEGFSEENPPKLHRFQLLRAGFDEPAVQVMRSTIERRLGNRDTQ